MHLYRVLSLMDFFIYTILKTVTDLKDEELDKLQRKTLQRLDDPPEFCSKY